MGSWAIVAVIMVGSLGALIVLSDQLYQRHLASLERLHQERLRYIVSAIDHQLGQDTALKQKLIEGCPPRTEILSTVQQRILVNEGIRSVGAQDRGLFASETHG